MFGRLDIQALFEKLGFLSRVIFRGCVKVRAILTRAVLNTLNVVDRALEASHHLVMSGEPHT